MAVVQLENVSKSWGDFKAVDNFNLTIEDEEFLVLLGPSGCGKTTTMRMIAGLEELSSGTIRIDDIIVNDLEPKDRDVSMVFQSYGLYPNMSVYENIRFPLKIRKIKKSLHEKLVMRAIKMVELEKFLKRKPAELSGGQKQRVALARALVRNPNIFLMDEPLSNLDAKLRVSTRAQIKHLQNKLKITTIYVTHDQVEAMTLADRVVVMNNGKIQQIGSPKEIYNRPFNTFVASFIGSPPMNLIPISIRNKTCISQHLKFSKINIKDGKYTLGFRAEDASIEKTGNFTGPIYSIELLGDSTIVTLKIKNNLLHIKTSNNFSSKIGEIVSVKIPNNLCHFFDSKTGIHL
jgi:multiple sugar transport system ATP-binding protein|tara:strand:+ start:440 stop:1480 length:1041 start_codon:yes stop_codon:yes gene_type:complete